MYLKERLPRKSEIVSLLISYSVTGGLPASAAFKNTLGRSLIEPRSISAEIVRFEGPRELVEIVLKAPALFLPEPRASQRFWEFFTANISNRNTRRAYYKAACRFSQWCEARGLTHLESVQPIHIAAFIEELELSKPTIKQHLAAAPDAV